MRVVGCAILFLISFFSTVLPASAAPSGVRPPVPGQQLAPRDGQRPHAHRNSPSGERGQRLSPEERRALRRDIRDADHQLYRPRRAM